MAKKSMVLGARGILSIALLAALAGPASAATFSVYVFSGQSKEPSEQKLAFHAVVELSDGKGNWGGSQEEKSMGYIQSVATVVNAAADSTKVMTPGVVKSGVKLAITQTSDAGKEAPQFKLEYRVVKLISLGNVVNADGDMFQQPALRTIESVNTTTLAPASEFVSVGLDTISEVKDLATEEPGKSIGHTTYYRFVTTRLD